MAYPLLWAAITMNTTMYYHTTFLVRNRFHKMVSRECENIIANDSAGVVRKRLANLSVI